MSSDSMLNFVEHCVAAVKNIWISAFNGISGGLIKERREER